MHPENKQANQSVQPTGGSHFVQPEFECQRRLPPVADAWRSAFLLAFKQSMKKILFLFWLVVSVGAFGSGCGTTGKTSHFALHIPATNSTVHATIKIASANMETNAAQLVAIQVFAWGKFDTNDLANIERSLRDTLSASEPVKAAEADAELRIHFVIRKYILDASNTGGAVLACIAWAATDAKDQILYREQFYVARKLYLVGTLVMLKDSVHQSIVRRIAESSIRLASRPGETPQPVVVEHTFLSYEEAISHLPKHLVSMGSPLMATTSKGEAHGLITAPDTSGTWSAMGGIPLLMPSGRATLDWNTPKPLGEIDWERYLATMTK